jgi:iron complex outermembrane receptor protein
MARRPFLVLCAAILASQPARGEDITLDTIVVTGTREPSALGDVAAAVSVVEKSDIQDARSTLELDEALNRVPGVFVQTNRNFVQDARIQIRGFGTRSAFGVRELKVLVDGLPLTLPDGQTQLDGIDPGAIDHIEVLRGPASSLYGNASGGVIQIFTEEGPDRPAASLRANGGDFGLGKFQLKGGGRAGNARLFVQSSYLRIDGFRDHSESESGVVNGKLQYSIGDATDLTFLLNAADTPEAEDPGALTIDEVRADRSQARTLNRDLNAGEEVRQVRTGVTGEHRLETGVVSAYGYFLYRDFQSRLPILPADGDGIVTFDRISPGGGARYSVGVPLWRWQSSFSAGVDTQYQNDDRRRFANSGGERGPLGLAQREEVTGVGVYVRPALQLRDDLEISGGARYDSVHYRVDVHQPAGAAGDSSRTLDAWSPAGGIRYTPLAWLSLYANVGTAFQVPTTTELANPDGPGFNDDVDPQRALSYELGARGEWRDRLSGELALFRIDLDDELIPFESESGRTAFRNAGRSRRHGMEINWQARPWASIVWSGAVTLIDAEFRDYQTDAGRFDGNDEPGIPSWWIDQELSYRRGGLYAALEAFIVDDLFVDDANTTRSSGHAIVNARAGYEHWFGGWTIAPFVTLANLTDDKYDGTVRLNARGGRYFEPAPQFNVVGGIEVGKVL